MEHSSTKFPLAIVSTNTTALREISWTLAAHGFSGVTYSDWSDQAPWRRSSTPAVVILDARDEQQIQTPLAASRSTSFIYRVALYDANMLSNPDVLMDLGADDLVRYPLDAGELISCVRRGARRLEFERRFDLYATFDQQRGVANRRGFTLQLDRKLQEDGDAPGHVLLILTIDFLETIREKHGIAAVENAISLVSETLESGLSSQDRRGLLEEGVFAVLMQDWSLADSLLFTSELNEQFKAMIGKDTRISLSGVAVGGPFGDSAESTIQRALVAVEYAKSWGGGQILDIKVVEQAHAEWQQKFIGRHTTEARQIMELLPLVLPLSSAKRSGCLGVTSFANGLLPPCVPVVDDVGHLVGVVGEQSLQSHGDEVLEAVEEYLEPVSTWLRSDSRLEEIVASLDTTEDDYLLVVENKKPIGYMTQATIAALQARPASNSRDRSFSEFDRGISSLVVPLI